MNLDLASAGDTLWGHIGLKLPDEIHTKWYPISAKNAGKVRRDMSLLRGGCGWIIAETLNNRLLAFNPKQMQRVWLLDDGNDAPENDFRWATTMDDYAGIPIELYRLMAAWIDGPSAFERAGSKQEQTAALELIEQGGFSDRRAEFAALLRNTVIHFTAGASASYEANHQNLVDLIFSIESEADDEIVEISENSNAFESYYPINMLRLVEIPLLEYEAACANSEVER